MEWIGWLLGAAYYTTNQQQDKAQRALVTLQLGIAKLAALWAGEIKKRRALEDEYYKTTETIPAECVRRFSATEEPLSLACVSDFDSANESLLNFRHEVLHPTLLQSDPTLWAKQYMTMALNFVGKRI